MILGRRGDILHEVLTHIEKQISGRGFGYAIDTLISFSLIVRSLAIVLLHLGLLWFSGERRVGGEDREG